MFRRFNFDEFMVYLNRDVLMLTDRFLTALLHSLDDSPSHISIKLRLLSHLHEPRASKFYRLWDHPIAARHLAQIQLASCFTNAPYRNEKPSSALPSFAGANLSDHVFPPLATLIKSIEMRNSGSPDVDLDMIQKAALLYTREEFGEDVSGMIL